MTLTLTKKFDVCRRTFVRNCCKHAWISPVSDPRSATDRPFQGCKLLTLVSKSSGKVHTLTTTNIPVATLCVFAVSKTRQQVAQSIQLPPLLLCKFRAWNLLFRTQFIYSDDPYPETNGNAQGRKRQKHHQDAPADCFNTDIIRKVVAALRGHVLNKPY